MDARGAPLLERARRSAVSALVAHVPPLAILGVFLLAYLLLLGEEHLAIAFQPVPIIVNLIPLAGIFLAGILVIGLAVLAVTRERRRSVERAGRWLASRDWAEILLLRVPVALLIIFAINYLHLSFKINIDRFVPYSWDRFFTQLDRQLFLGWDPWILTHWLVPDTLATQIFDTSYRVWFLVMQMSIFAAAFMRPRDPVRLTFLTAYGLNWLIGGVLLAIVFSSAGPVYMERITGDATFAPLMERLYSQSATARIDALAAQEWLWEGYTLPHVAPYGISAFPSLHLAIAATCACLGFSLSRALGWALAAFTGVIFVASVHLGWHYAVDGIAGIALALALWRASDRICAWWLARTKQGADPGRGTAAARSGPSATKARGTSTG